MESVPGSVHLLANEIYHHPSPVILLNGRNAYLRWLGLLYSTSVGIFVFSIEGNNVPPSSVTFLLQLWKLARRYRQTIAREVSLSLSVIPKRTRNVWMGRECIGFFNYKRRGSRFSHGLYRVFLAGPGQECGGGVGDPWRGSRVYDTVSCGEQGRGSRRWAC